MSRRGGQGVVALSDIASTVITARSAYGSSCHALCFLLENKGRILNALLILLITAFWGTEKVQRATTHLLVNNGGGCPIPALDYHMKIKDLEY